MINTINGSIELEGHEPIFPTIRFEELKSQTLGSSREELDYRNDWTWIIDRNVASHGKFFILAWVFYKNALHRIYLTFQAEAYPASESWENWSTEEELRKLSVLEQFLDDLFGKERTFTWGQVTAAYDEKSAGSSIIITYS